MRVHQGRRTFLAAGLGLVSIAAARRATAQGSPEVWRITAEELKPLVTKGEAILLDVRGKSAWDAGHIEGAVHIPMAELRQRLGELPKDKVIAAYCTCQAEATSAGAAILLKQNGFAKAAALKDGVDAWKRVGGKVTNPAVTPPAR
jgi:rhodanese-related sulfurtransferase